MNANTNDIESVLKQHVKRTPELPQDGEQVLLWHNERWQEAKYSGYKYWFAKVLVTVQDGQYWLPLPTFDPSEVQE